MKLYERNYYRTVMAAFLIATRTGQGALLGIEVGGVNRAHWTAFVNWKHIEQAKRT